MARERDVSSAVGVYVIVLLSMQIFDEFYADLFGGNEADGHALLVGAVSESVKAGFGISDLAVLARERGRRIVAPKTARATAR